MRRAFSRLITPRTSRRLRRSGRAPARWRSPARAARRRRYRRSGRRGGARSARRPGAGAPCSSSAGMSKRRRWSTTGSTSPRRLTTPSRNFGVFGTRVICVRHARDLVDGVDRQAELVVAQPEDQELPFFACATVPLSLVASGVSAPPALKPLHDVLPEQLLGRQDRDQPAPVLAAIDGLDPRFAAGRAPRAPSGIGSIRPASAGDDRRACDPRPARPARRRPSRRRPSRGRRARRRRGSRAARAATAAAASGRETTSRRATSASRAARPRASRARREFPARRRGREANSWPATSKVTSICAVVRAVVRRCSAASARRARRSRAAAPAARTPRRAAR